MIEVMLSKSVVPTYRNPIYPHACPDPFVLKFLDGYWCYCTGLQPDGRAFGILRSPDLVHWQPVGSALDRLPGDDTCYWAPEVTYRDGVFYLYYSVGDEEHMQIRVATSIEPGGPFTDSGRRLTDETFAIDPHVFIDDGDRWYCFYATDFLDYERVGTGTVMDRMLGPFTLEGKPHPVTRARYDWQIYDPQRANKGGLRWHTIEGSFVLKHDGRYYQMFSGGNWQNKTYGVSYAVSDRIDMPEEWTQHSDGERILPILRTVPEAGVIGPGHNSVVRGPDNHELFCVYHRWQPETEERVMAIDRLRWEGEQLKVLGPTTADQPAPQPPEIAGFLGFSAGSGAFRPEGEAWRLSPAGGQARAGLATQIEHFILECWLRFPPSKELATAGIALVGAAGGTLRLALTPGEHRVDLEAHGQSHHRALPPGFDPASFHLVRVENGPEAARISLDGNRLAWDVNPLAPIVEVQLFSQGAPAAFAAFALTRLGPGLSLPTPSPPA